MLVLDSSMVMILGTTMVDVVNIFGKSVSYVFILLITTGGSPIHTHAHIVVLCAEGTLDFTI